MFMKLLHRKMGRHLSSDLKIAISRLAPQQFIRWYAYSSADYFLISYPKCGRTWLRLMLGQVIKEYYQLSHVNLLDLGGMAASVPEIPKIVVTHDDDPAWKSPEELITDKRVFSGGKVIFLARDPRDVIVSIFFHKSKRGSNYQGTLHDYVHDRVGSIDSLIEFYNIWARNRYVPRDFLLVLYEKMHQDPCRELSRLLNFLGLSKIENSYIRKAVDFASFDNMRKMEVTNELNSQRLRRADGANEGGFKTRRGKVGGYRDYLSDEDIRFLNNKIGKNLANYYQEQWNIK